MSHIRKSPFPSTHKHTLRTNYIVESLEFLKTLYLAGCHLNQKCTQNQTTCKLKIFFKKQMTLYFRD